MSEDEKKAIEKIKNFMNNEEILQYKIKEKDIDIILNLIDRLQKELEQEKEKNKKLLYKYKKNGRVLFTPEAIAEKCVSKDKIRDIIEYLRISGNNIFADILTKELLEE